jgi:hypothetical protein
VVYSAAYPSTFFFGRRGLPTNTPGIAPSTVENETEIGAKSNREQQTNQNHQTKNKHQTNKQQTNTEQKSASGHEFPRVSHKMVKNK